MAGGPPDRPARRRRAPDSPPAVGVVAAVSDTPTTPRPVPLHHQSRPSLPAPADPFRFREMDALTEMGVAYARQVRNVRRAVLADTGALRQFTSPGRKAVEEVEEGLFQVQRMHSHLVARANNLVYRLQDVLLQEESNRLRKQMHWIATLPAEKQTSQVRDREHDLIVRIVRIVNKRDAILAEHHVEQRRAANELRQMEKEYQRWRRDWTRPSTATATSAKKSTSKTFLTFRSFKKRVAKTVGRVASPKKKKGKRSPTAPAQSTSTELCCSKL
uniref:BMERB domain-containing protein n=1 Tax=Rhipicephalus appendiculatus TaxID=34631 RepID=A0A131YX85_RHIAP